jgi:branched-chain amino acid transport system ATP-binding protein
MPADTVTNETTPGPGDEPAPTAKVDVDAARAALKDVPHEPGAKKPDPIVVVDNIRRTFGGLTAVDVEHVEIQRGVITGLIGPNGAGKTTFFNLLTGFDSPDVGEWSFNGKSLKGVPAYRVARLGMVRTFQLTKVLSKLTVLENMRVGATGQNGESLFKAMFAPMWRSQENANTDRADRLLERFLLIKKREDFAGSLSGGQRKLLEMARALMADPDLVMLDEPMAGVNPALKQSLLGHVKSLRDDGRTVLFVEHDMDMVRDISDWVIVMAQGKVIAEGPPDSVMGDQRVIDAYLGSHHDQDLSEDMEQKILAEAQAEIAEEHGEAPPVAATTTDDQGDQRV